MTRLVTSFLLPPKVYDHLDVVPFDQVDKFLPDDIWHIYDGFTPSDLDKIIEQKGTPGAIVNDLWSEIEWSQQHRCYQTIAWLAWQLDHDFLQLTYPDKVTTTKAACIQVNKKQINRYLALKYAEWFQIDFDYTWGGIGREFDMSVIIGELDSLENFITPEQRSFLFAPIELERRWIDCPDVDATVVNDSNVREYGMNNWVWANGLGDLFYNSAVALITESVSYQRGSIFTEKTAYSTLGLNFPIWVGGYNQAREWKKLGFDIFEDVIDHSYENCGTLIERCHNAFSLNLEILQNKDLAAKLRQQHMPRLLKNRELMLSGLVTKRVKETISTWPEPVRSIGGDFLLTVFKLK